MYVISMKLVSCVIIIKEVQLFSHIYVIDTAVH